MQPTVTSPPSKKKGKYDITFKLKVIQWAEKHSNRAAGSKFGLNESTIRGWRKSAVASNLDSLGEFSRGVLSLHQPLHGVSSGHVNGHQATTGLNVLAAASNRAKLHDPLRPRRSLGPSANSSTSHSMSGVESGGESPSHSIAAIDERELARLSCSPSDDGYYEDVGCYQEEVVHEDDPSHMADSKSPSPAPSPPPVASQGPVLKTISHQVTSKPFPEIQLPFTVIVCKSVRDHWLQRFASQKPVHPATEFDTFAQHLGLERR